ncbi:hypothetical protein EDB19DRAFT_1712743 [Suillus lakei]|nr:hypothetical protein EDB19DRAFT_1712743 [Suillus lakei]
MSSGEILSGREGCFKILCSLVRGSWKPIQFFPRTNERGAEQGRRDNLEALGNILLFLLHGRLPWQGVYSASRPNYCGAHYTLQSLPLFEVRRQAKLCLAKKTV